MTRPANLFRMTPEIKAAIGRHPATSAPSVAEQAVRAAPRQTAPAAGEETVGKRSAWRCHICGRQWKAATEDLSAAVNRHCDETRHGWIEWVWR